MIDTIVLRIHNLLKYERTKNRLFAKNSTASTKVIVIEETGEVVPDNFAHKVVYHDSDYVKPVFHRGSSFIKSSSYDLTYSINMERGEGFIEFNFSIPKYLFGCNIIQFINYFDTGYDATFTLLRGFIDRFLKSSCFNDEVDLIDVEINRIDLCYNQFFPTQSDALQYLEYQKKLLVNFEGAEKKTTPFKSGVAIQTDRYMFKIYHKGPEFRKNDYSKLAKKGGNPKGFDLKNLSECADRILRYEVSFRNSFMNYAFQRMYFDNSKHVVHGIYRYLYKTLNIDGAYSNTSGRVDKKFLTTMGIDATRLKSYKAAVKPLKVGKSLKRKKFCFASSYDHWENYKKLWPEDWILGYKDVEICTFDINMFRYLFSFFWLYVKKFQVERTISISQLERRFTVLNKNVEIRNKYRSSGKESANNIARMKMYAFMSVSGSLRKQLVSTGMLSERQYYRVLALFKKVGLGDYNPDLRTVQPDTGYQEYRHLFGSFH